MHTSPKNKTTLVTGVSSGIGREIAQLLAERGARVFGTVRDPQSASPIRGVEIVRMEVTDDSSVSEAIQRIVEKAGPVQHLVNNAGYSVTGALEEISIEEAKQQFETNFFGVLRVTNAVLPRMRQDGYGRIVNISSVVGFSPRPIGASMPRANTRWRDTPRRWTMKSGDSAFALCWSNLRIRGPKSAGTPNPQKSPSRFTRLNESV